jgi:hypothetical protein
MPVGSYWVDGSGGGTALSAANLNAQDALLRRGINVKEVGYGALGDDANDDTAEIQLAIDAANTNGGGIVYLPEGVYRVSSALSIPNFVNLVGEGQSTILRCTGNHYAINFNPGHRSGVSNLQIDKTGANQTSGGGIDFTNAGSNIWLDGIYFGNGLFKSINAAPSTSQTVYIFRRLRWNGVTGCNTAIQIGGGAGLVTDVYLSDVIGTASTTSDMVTWLTAPSNADTL